MTPAHVEVVVPWLPGCPYRERAWNWLRPRYGWPVRVGTGSSPWVKADAVTPAVEACAEGAIVVIADADVWSDGVTEAVDAVEHGARWAIPHNKVHRLTADGTDAVLAGADWRSRPLDQPPYTGVAGGGYVIARRETLLEVPMPRIVGWGQDDECWAIALTTLAGTPWRGSADLVHLWHPPQERLSRRRGSVEGWAMLRRYRQAAHDVRAMRRLIEETTGARDSAEHALHDHAPHRVR